MDLLKFMIELDIYYYFSLKNMMQFMIGRDILKVKKVVLHIAFIKFWEESGLIHIILYCFGALFCIVSNKPGSLEGLKHF